ncbi:DMT family transporter [Candidatus Woesearchaeota archaeon]|nr:DMT family transporter [Candidatus Woesearchaeota archaeon]
MEKKGLYLVLATALISGVSIFINKFGVKGMDPALFTTSKNILVAVFLISTVLAMKEWKTLKELSTKAWGQLALIGLIGGSIPFLLFFTGLKMTTAAQAGFLHKTMFIWVGILAAVLLKEKISRNMVIGGVLLLLGNLLVLKITGFEFGFGDFLIILATLLWAGEVTLSRYVLTTLDELPGRVVAFGRMGFGSIYLLLYLAVTGKLQLYAGLSGASWLWILVTGAFLYGYVFTFYEGLKRVPASIATAILLLGTVITTLLNLAWNGTIAWQQIAGSALLLGGVIMFTGIRTWLPAPQKVAQ